jgi:HK97 family phage major capsid protein
MENTENKDTEVKDTEQTINLSASELKNIINEELETFKSTLPIERKGNLFNTEDPNESEVKAFNIIPKAKQNFRKSLVDLAERKIEKLSVNVNKAMSTGGAGQYLITPEDGDEVIMELNQWGIARQFCTPKEMTSNIQDFPRVEAGDAYFTTELASITASDLSDAQVRLSAEALIYGVEVSRKLADWGTYPVEQTIFANAPISIGEKEDLSLFQGVAGGPTGLANTTGLLGVTGSSTAVSTALTGVLEDTSNMVATVAAVNPRNLMNAAWFMNPTVANVLRKQKINGETNHFVFGNPALGIPDTLWGYPIYQTNAIPGTATVATKTKYIYFGNLSNVFFGQLGGMVIEASTQGSLGTANAFNRHSKVFKVVELIDIEAAKPNALCAWETA